MRGKHLVILDTFFGTGKPSDTKYDDDVAESLDRGTFFSGCYLSGI